jgi:hypothetical protein
MQQAQFMRRDLPLSLQFKSQILQAPPQDFRKSCKIKSENRNFALKLPDSRGVTPSCCRNVDRVVSRLKTMCLLMDYW